jgi:hypothetical protein
VKKERHYLQTMVTKEVYEELSRKSCICQDDLTQALEKVRPYPLISRKVFKEILGNMRPKS